MWRCGVEFSEVIRTRYSVRAYSNREVSEEALQNVLQAFALAPTAANRQALGLIVIHTEGRAEELRRIYRADWFASQPPIVLCACVTPTKCWTRRDGKNYADVDAAIAMDHAILAATAEGLGTCWVGAFDPAAAREVLALPPDVEPIAFAPLGYAADRPSPRLRKKTEQLVHYDRW
jgi:nitroreductase